MPLPASHACRPAPDAALARQGSGPGASTAPAAAPKGLPTGRGSAGGWKIGAAASGNLFGADEHRVAAENARKVAAGGVGGQEMVLAGRGLRQVPEEVWAAGEQVIKLDLSCNQVGGALSALACELASPGVWSESHGSEAHLLLYGVY